MPEQKVYSFFLESLKNRIALEGVTQIDLARMVGTSKTHLNTVLKGKKRAGAKLQKSIAAHFGVSLKDMIEEGYDLLHGKNGPVPESSGRQSAQAEQKVFQPFASDERENLADLALHVATDIQKMQDNLSRCQGIIESIGDGVLVISAKSKIVEYQNQAHKDIFGENLVGQNCSEIINHPCLESCPAINAISTGKISYGRYSINDKTIAITASPVRNESGKIVRVVLTARDVSERQKILSALEKAEERLLGVISVLGLPVIIFDEEGHIIFTNSLVRELISASSEDLVDLETLIECLRPQIKDFTRFEIWMRAVSKSQKVEQIDIEYFSGRKSSLISQPIFSATGEFLGRVGMSGLPSPVDSQEG